MPKASKKIESLLVFLYILSNQEKRKLFILLWLCLSMVRLVKKFKMVLNYCFTVYHWYDKITNPWFVVKCAWALWILLLVSDFPISVVYVVLQCQSRLYASRSNGIMTLVNVCTKGLHYRSVSQISTKDQYCRAVYTISILQICTSDLYCIVCDWT